jgi:hypothetical protein
MGPHVVSVAQSAGPTLLPARLLAVLARPHEQFEPAPLQLLFEHPEAGLLAHVENLVDLVVGAPQLGRAPRFQFLQGRQALLESRLGDGTFRGLLRRCSSAISFTRWSRFARRVSCSARSG